MYFATLLVVFVWFIEFHMDFVWYVFGIFEVLFFFIGSQNFILSWKSLSPNQYKKKIFWVTFIISFIYVTVTYFMYIDLRGEPFEFDPSDGLAYHEDAVWFVEMFKDGYLSDYWKVFISLHELSDTGYIIYLNIVYLLTDNSIFIARILKCFYHAWLCVLIYKIAARNFSESTARMAAIFCMLMPQILFYTCSHRKEMEMILLSTLCIERIDFLLRNAKNQIKQIILAILLIGLLFTFRTVIGIAAAFGMGSALLLTSTNLISKRRKWFIGVWAGIAAIVVLGGPIINEVESIWQRKIAGAAGKSMEWRASESNAGSDGRTNTFAKYAGAAVFAPLITVFPFPTMVRIADQENQQRLNGGYFIKNFMGLFVLLMLFKELKTKQFKKHILIFGYTFSYLGIIALSEFAQSERFHLPALPFLLMFAAYGIETFNNKDKKIVPWYIIFLFLVNVGWNWFKLAGRGYV